MLHNFSKDFGSIVGSYIPITFGDKILNVTVKLSFNKSLHDIGRSVTACFWPDDANFDISKVDIGSSYANYAKAVSSSGKAQPITINSDDGIKYEYINTNTIPDNTVEQVTFTFDSENIRANRIFFALLSTSNTISPFLGDYIDFHKGGLTVDCSGTNELYFRHNDITVVSNMMVSDDKYARAGLTTQIEVIHQDADYEDESNVIDDEKVVYCSDIRYRTWSEPKNPIEWVDNNNKVKYENKYTLAYLDGGENPKDLNQYDENIENIEFEIKDTVSLEKYAVKPYIINKNNNFISKYYIPEGRLKDVVFDKPHIAEYHSVKNVTQTAVPEPRWVFKRSRIMFTIPPVKKNNKLITSDVYLRYKVITTIFDKNVYTSDWKVCRYTQNNRGLDIKLVICPRDEGVLDNMSFKVVFSRSIVNTSNYGPETTYYFHTYQKPTLNIAYPKIIRNESTKKGFKHAKILTSNMYSNFDGENAIVNKYVCDALNVIFATPQNDNSGIPQFVRFYLAEFKYGRTGLIVGSGDSKKPDWGTKDNMQALYRSDKENDYTKLKDILKNNANYRTAYMSSIYVNDGQPLLLSGRFTDEKLSDIGKSYKLWTYRTWDEVNSAIDVEVGNAWPIKSTEHYEDENSEHYGKEIRYKTDENGNLIEINPTDKNEWDKGKSKETLVTPLVTGDHMGVYTIDETWEDNKPKTSKSSLSNVILFRAGYIYLLRARMFHGAAAGAIGSKYYTFNSVVYGRYSSGSYDYSDADVYVGNYPYFPNNPDSELRLNDVGQHGELKPFTQKTRDENGNIKYLPAWLGPDDGTSGLSLTDDKLNQTYPGFSQVDYTIIEPVCPYVSKSNMITVHPTCPEIGANQWITFSYRHLSKNIGGIDSYNADGSKMLVFGKRAGGCQNTITRIMSTYNTCIEAIISKYRELSKNIKSFFGPITDNHTAEGDDCRKPDVTIERISIWLEPIEKHFNTTEDGNQYFTSNDKIVNTPMVYKLDIAGKDMKAIQDLEIYCHLDRNPGDDGNKWIEDAYPFEVITKDTAGNVVKTEINYSESGLYEFNLYKGKLSGEKKDKNTYIHPYIDRPYHNWAENNIVWRRCAATTGNSENNFLAAEPMGNTYRWQPVINAMKSNTEEIKIEDYMNTKGDSNDPRNYPILESSVQNDNTFLSTNIWPVHCRTDNDGAYYDLQTKYAYNDDTDASAGDWGNTRDSNTRDRRFTINEFAGLTDGDKNGHKNIESSGYSVMYTTISRSQAEPYKHNGNFKFFTSNNALQFIENYGKLFLRVPTSQDCENGKVTAFDGLTHKDLPNVGNLGAKGAYSVNENENNVSPIVRTTHYLYFKTWINTTFYMQVEATVQNYTCNGYYTNKDGDEVHRGDTKEKCTHCGETRTHSGVFMFDGEQLHLIQKNKVHNIEWRVETEDGPKMESEEVSDDLSALIEYTSKTAKDKENEYPEDPKSSRTNALKAARLNAYNSLLNPIDKLVIEPDINYRIKFGNSQGLTEVYAEDNNGWGRCLSADDISAKKIKYDGTIGDKVPSGGIEVPVLVRYTPLLQPKLISEICKDTNTGNTIICEMGNKNITVLQNKRNKKCTFEFANGNTTDGINTVLTDEFKMNICYPFIAENNTYYTKHPNGGIDNIYYSNYSYDADSFPTNSPEMMNDSSRILDDKNMDFLGGYGICTAYTILLVPSDPDINRAVNDGVINKYEKDNYFNNTNKHWNFYKQPANYYKGGEIFKIRSKSQNKQGPVLVAYNVQPNETIDGINNKLDYTQDGDKCPASWVNNVLTRVKGRNFQSITFNINNLINGNIIYQNEENAINFSEFESKTGIELSGESNVLKPGLIYDLVIVPIYSNLTVTKHNYINGAGKLNDTPYGGGTTDEGKNVHLAGSNPLVLFNYLQYSFKRDIDGGSSTPIPEPIPTIHEQPDPNIIWDSNPVIVFPNVDNVLYNIDSGIINECPGFWLNNSFKLVLRMPSYRTNSTKFSKDWDLKKYVDTDDGTIEIASNGMLDSTLGDTANDFLFEDIQIHIGKISELEEYGYPDNLHLNLNKLTNKEDLARAHIISYKHYANSSVFSKKLTVDLNSEEDSRELLTGGALSPIDEHYKNRFIEINLSNAQIWDETKNRMVPIYTKYPEGYYIQFRYKTAYSSGTDITQWSPWYGGSCDGGRHWWGHNGTDYYVPVRNYTDIHTDFRSYVTESYPGSNVRCGAGSYMPFGDIDNSSMNNPKDAKNNQYYHIGSGNQGTKRNPTYLKDSQIVPDNYGIEIDETLNTDKMIQLLGKTIELSKNHDNAYETEIMYILKHDTNFKIPDNTSNLHQHMWEMLYIDYIIRNLCKLYYKAKYNNMPNDFKQFNKYLQYHSAVPYMNNEPFILNWKTCGWDDTEYHLFNTSETIKNFKGLTDEKSYNEDKSKIETQINGDRYEGPNSLNYGIKGINEITNRHIWNRNKYYRKIITKNDFDELNSHLSELTEYLRHNLLCGSNDDNIKDPVFGIKDVVPCSSDELNFDKSRKLIIGSKIDNEVGLTRNNNINHLMVHSNYLKNTWSNILKICRPGTLVKVEDTKTSI